jgi:hypothetical protein
MYGPPGGRVIHEGRFDIDAAGEMPLLIESYNLCKLEVHTKAAATALNHFAYNFIKIHRTLRTSPAMAAGVTDQLWNVNDLVALWEAYEQRRAERAA